jgi:acetyl-CoA carboxylase biotin carboxyl carrier protein
MEIKQFKQIINALRNEDIEELEWKEGEFYLKLKRTPRLKSSAEVLEPVQITDDGSTSSENAVVKSDMHQNTLAPGNQYIISPIVGSFYRAPSPKAEPYVREGDKVSKGKVLCIIEAMKLMNELEAEFPCEIVRIIAQNTQPVEFGEPLFEVKPL